MKNLILHPSSFILRRRRRAFTLNELLVVMAIIVLVLAIAIPAFNVMTTGKSIEASENQMSAFLAAARSDAIGMQDPRGVIIFVDPASGRVTMAEVWIPPVTPPPPPAPQPPPNILDLYPNKDEMKLPAGVGLRMVPTSNSIPNIDSWPRFGVIMFDGNGQLLVSTVNYVATNGLTTRLTVAASSTLDRVPPPGKSFPYSDMSSIGFLLFDKAKHDEQPNTPAALQKFLQENAVPYLINRYNGTLMKGQ